MKIKCSTIKLLGLLLAMVIFGMGFSSITWKIVQDFKLKNVDGKYIFPKK